MKKSLFVLALIQLGVFNARPAAAAVNNLYCQGVAQDATGTSHTLLANIFFGQGPSGSDSTVLKSGVTAKSFNSGYTLQKKGIGTVLSTKLLTPDGETFATVYLVKAVKPQGLVISGVVEVFAGQPQGLSYAVQCQMTDPSENPYHGGTHRLDCNPHSRACF